MAIEIFFSYSHKDEKLREELEKQLSLLKWQGLITDWHDRRILAGQEWVGEIDNHLNAAQIILLLVSLDFMASNYCYEVEVKQAMERHKLGEALVIPIILRPVYWQGAPFGKLQALPTDGKPVTDPDWHNLDRAFFDVAEGIRRAINSFHVQIHEAKQEQQLPVVEHILERPKMQVTDSRDLTKLDMGELSGLCLGNYRLVRLLGKGGFSEVYLGQHLQSNAQAAIKVLKAQLMDEDIFSFSREVQHIANLVHPHIIRVFDFDVDQGTSFLVMDYAPNGTLRQRHPKGSKLPLATVISYVKQIADALQFAHDNQTIHRDVKPENMLVGWQNQVLLSDFSLSSLAHTTASNPLLAMSGTIHYMAPEQVNGNPRRASDQYALGVVVYEWLCGTPPFHGSVTEIAVQQLVAPPPGLRDKVSISRSIESVVMKALAKEPQQRFASIQAFADALEAASKR